MKTETDMASAAQLLANQKNAALSTGPRTAEGKAASARNATRHGLSSAFRVLAHEDQEEFDRVLEDLRAYYRPRDIVQNLLVDQMAKAQWLLARAQRLQTVALDLLAGVEDESSPDVKIVQAMRAANSDVLARLERYAASAERSFHKAYRELDKARTRQTFEEVERRRQQLTPQQIRNFIEGPLPDHPVALNLARPVQNEPNRPRLSDAELALRL
jgi:hypothetical protein